MLIDPRIIIGAALVTTNEEALRKQIKDVDKLYSQIKGAQKLSYSEEEMAKRDQLARLQKLREEQTTAGMKSGTVLRNTVAIGLGVGLILLLISLQTIG